MGALSVTWDEHYRAPFQPLLGPVTFVDPDSPERWRPRSPTTTAAIIAEPIRGEGGIRPLPAGVRRRDRGRLPPHRHAAHRRRSADAGSAAPVTPFYFQALGWKPDLDVVGKALGSRRAGRRQRWCPSTSRRRSPPGDHGSTYGGNLLATRAAAFFPRAVDGQRPARSRRDRWRSLRAPAAHARAASTRSSSSPWRRPDAWRSSLPIDAAPVVDLRASTDCSSIAPTRRSSGCCRR